MKLADWRPGWRTDAILHRCGGEVVEPDGCFERVPTHAAHRRQGLAATLVHAVARFGLDAWHCPRLRLAADPEGPAWGLYRRPGFAPVSTGIGLQRNAPQDRPAA